MDLTRLICSLIGCKYFNMNVCVRLRVCVCVCVGGGVCVVLTSLCFI